MKIKKSILCLILMFCVYFVSGCATIQYSRTVVEGVVQDVICVQLDKEEFSTLEYNKVKKEIDKDFRTYISKINEWKNQFYPSEKFSIELYQAIKKNIVVTYNAETEGKFYLELTFSSAGYFYLFYGVTGIDGVEEKEAIQVILDDIGPFLVNKENPENIEINPFSYKYNRFSSESIYNTVLNLNVLGENETYLKKYVDLLDGKYSEEDLLENVEILQVFGTNESRVFSNANDGKIDSGNGLYYHCWDINKMALNGESTIEVYFKSPLGYTWYALGIAISVIAILIAVLCSKKKFVNEIQTALTLDFKDED